MRLAAISTVLVLGAAVLLPATEPAQAQSRQYRDTGTVFYSTDENGRRRTRIIVQPRSFLDGGTEVLPGERKFQDYAFPPGNPVSGSAVSSANDALGPGLGFHERQPLNNWFDVPHRYGN